jgi:hypothetical protein
MDDTAERHYTEEGQQALQVHSSFSFLSQSAERPEG